MTPRITPVAGFSAAAGGFLVHAETLVVETGQRVELVDVTDRIMELTRTSGVREGLVSLWSLHTTCAVFINEAQQALHAGIKRFSRKPSSVTPAWMHNDPAPLRLRSRQR